MIVLALIFTVGELYLIATYAQFSIWAKTDEYKSTAYALANDVLSNKELATHKIILYAPTLDKYNNKKVPNLNLCDLDYSVTITTNFNYDNIVHQDTWVMKSYGSSLSKPVTHIDVPVLVLYKEMYTNKQIVIPGKMEVVIYENIYKKIACHMKAAELSKNETFSIGCLNKDKTGDCEIIIKKKYTNAPPYQVCFDEDCKICEDISYNVYTDLGTGSGTCEPIFDKKYYNFPGSGILSITKKTGAFDISVYKEDNGGGTGAG